MHNNSELRKPPLTDKARIISWTKVPNVDMYSITYHDETTGGADNIFITKADLDRAFGAIPRVPLTDKARIISWTKVPNADMYSITYHDENTGGADNIFITKADFDRAFGAIVSGRYSLVKKDFGVIEKEQHDIGHGVTLERDPGTNRCEIKYNGAVVGAGAASSQDDFNNMLKAIKAFAEEFLPDPDDEDEDDSCACCGCPGCPLG